MSLGWWIRSSRSQSEADVGQELLREWVLFLTTLSTLCGTMGNTITTWVLALSDLVVPSLVSHWCWESLVHFGLCLWDLIGTGSLPRVLSFRAWVPPVWLALMAIACASPRIICQGYLLRSLLMMSANLGWLPLGRT